MSEFGFDSTASQVAEGIDLSGRVAVVTGASGGLGKETARALAERGARVTLTVRDLEKGEQAAREIRDATGNDAVDLVELELASPQSVRAPSPSRVRPRPR